MRDRRGALITTASRWARLSRRRRRLRSTSLFVPDGDGKSGTCRKRPEQSAQPEMPGTIAASDAGPKFGLGTFLAIHIEVASERRKHCPEHARGEDAGVGVVSRAMIAVEHGQRIDRMGSAMRESEPR